MSRIVVKYLSVSDVAPSSKVSVSFKIIRPPTSNFSGVERKTEPTAESIYLNEIKKKKYFPETIYTFRVYE